MITHFILADTANYLFRISLRVRKKKRKEKDESYFIIKKKPIHKKKKNATKKSASVAFAFNTKKLIIKKNS